MSLVHPLAANPGTATPQVGSDNAITTGSVFGTFLTLVLSLVTQQPGSLLYAKPRNSIGRIAFFLWRLNPLECATEALLILYLLVYEAFRPSRRADVGQRICVTSAAILRMRNRGYLPGRLFPRSDSVSPDGFFDGQPAPSIPASYRPRSSLSPHNNSLSNSAYGTEHDHAGEPRISNRMSTQVHSSPATPNTQGRDELSSYEQATRSHAELMISLISFACGAITILKLFAIVVPPQIFLITGCLMSGWAAIQSLSLLSYLAEPDSIKPAILSEYILQAETRLQQTIGCLILSIAPLSLYGYIVFVCAQTTDEYTDERKCSIITLGSLYFKIGRPYGLPLSKKTLQGDVLLHLRTSIITLQHIISSLLLVSAFWLTLRRCKSPEPFFCQTSFLSIGWIIMIVLLTSETVLTSLTWRPGNDNGNESWSLAILNTFMAIGVLSNSMSLYNAEGSYKPDWLDWLGR